MSTRRQFNARPVIERIPGQTHHALSSGAGRDPASISATACVGGDAAGGGDVADQAGATRRRLEIGMSHSALNSVMRQWK
jgi:hypothetical protein